MLSTLSINKWQVGLNDGLEKCSRKIKNVDSCFIMFCCWDTSVFFRLRVRAMINIHEGESSCCNMCSVLCPAHLNIMKHVLEQFFPLSWQWAFSHSDSTAIKMLLTGPVSDKIALGTNNFIWMFCPSDIHQTKMRQLLSPSVSSSTQWVIPAQQGQTPIPLNEDKAKDWGMTA